MRRARLAFSTYLGGSDAEDDIDIALDSSGRVYVAGTTESPDFPSVRPIPTASSSVFLKVLSRAGDRLLYSTRLPSVPGDDNVFHAGTGVAVGRDGRVHVTGWATAAFVTAVAGVDECAPRGAAERSVGRRPDCRR